MFNKIADDFVEDIPGVASSPVDSKRKGLARNVVPVKRVLLRETCTRRVSAHPNPADRRRTALLLGLVHSERTATPSGAPCSISDATSTFPRRNGRCAPARRHPGRPDAVGRRRPTAVEHEAQRIAASWSPRHAGEGTGRRLDRPARRRPLRRPPPQRRRRAGRLVGARAVGLPPCWPSWASTARCDRGGRCHRRASGPAGLGARGTAGCSNAAASASCRRRLQTASQLYRASDALVKHREAIEAHLFKRAMGLFDLQPTVTLYDLTNTYFEGEAGAQPQAKRGHSKEKRSDCPLLTLGLMLDASGFVRRSQLRRQRPGTPHAGRHARGTRCAGRRPGGHGPRRRHRGRHRVAARQPLPLSGRQPRAPPAVRRRDRRVDPDPIQTDRASAQGGLDRPRRGAPVLLLRAAGREGTRHRRAFRRPLRDGPDQAQRRAGTPPRAQAPRPGLAAHRATESKAFPRRTALPNRGHRRRDRRQGRRRHLDPSSAGRLDGHTSGRLLPAQQRDRLGRRRPVAHLYNAHRRRGRLPRAEVRTASHLPPQAAAGRGHLFITVIAYQLVQVIRTRLRAHGEHASWTTLRRILEGQQRVTATFRRPDRRTLHVRTATQAEPEQRAIYDALGIDPQPGGVRKTTI